MSQSNAIVVSVILDGQNYREWAFCLETALRGYGLAFHLTDDPPEPTTNNSNAADIKTWKINDGKKIHSVQHNDMTIDEYYSAFERLMGPLLSMVPQCTANECKAHKFIEKFFTYRFVMGVKTDLDSIRTRLLHDSSSLTMSRALSDLIAEETHIQSMATAHHGVLAASNKGSYSRGGLLLSQASIARSKLIDLTSALSIPKKLADFRARRAAQGCGTPLRASVSAATAAAPIGACTSSWALDSGASFHITPDQSQLIDCKLVNDGSSIQTVDGSSNRGCD
uniref:Retrotransposon Copia-like N-terminal domain-containing protein n=1 Tax=Oryza brachyantha TaxID=4533 RepID=J3L5P4_ORYBR